MRTTTRLYFSLLLSMLFPFLLSGQEFVVATNGPNDLSPCQQAIFQIEISNVSSLYHPAGTMSYSLPAGLEFVQLSATVQLLDSTDKQQPIFIFPGLGPNERFAFQLTVQTTCAALGKGGVTDSLFIQSGGNLFSLAAHQYNLFTPALNLLPGQNWDYTGPTGSTYNCSFTLINNGFGDIGYAFVYNPFAKAGLKLLNTSIGQWQGDTLSLSGADFGPDSLLTQEEHVVVTLTFLLDICTGGAVTVEYGWGCLPPGEGKHCFSSLESYITTATAPPSPVLKLTKTGNFTTPAPCQTSPFQANLVNSGDVTAFDVMFEVFISQGLCFPMRNFVLGNMPLSATPVINSGYYYWRIFATALTTDPDGPGGLNDEDSDGFYDDLPPGSGTNLSWLVSFEPGCKSCNGNINNNSINISASATNLCNKTVQAYLSPQLWTGIYVSGGTFNDFTIFEHAEGVIDTFRFSFNTVVSGLNTLCPNDSFTLRLPLPATLQVPSGSFQPLFNGNNIPYWTAADSALYLLLPSGSGLLELPLLTLCPPGYPTSPCSYPPEPPIYKIHGEITWMCGNGCSVPMLLFCFDSKPFIVECPLDTVVNAPHGLFTQQFSIQRIPANPNPQIAMPWDTLLLRATALIKGDTLEDFDNAMFRVYYWNASALPYLRFYQAVLTVADAESGQAISCGVSAPDVKASSGYHSWLINLQSLFQPGGCFADAGIHLSPGDFLSMNLLAIVTENIPQGQILPLESLRAGFPYSWQQILSECNSKSADFKVVNPYKNFDLYPEYSLDPCKDFRVYARFTQNIGSSITADPFPSEPRPVFVYDTLVITVPPGYRYVPDSVIWEYKAGDGASTLPLPPLLMPLPNPQAEPLPDGTQRLTFTRLKGLPVTDFYGNNATATLSFRVKPVCPVDPSQWLQAKLDAHGYLSSLDSVNIKNWSGQFFARTLSGIACSTILPLSTGRYPSWEVTFINNNYFNLSDPVIVVHTGSRLLLTKVTDITNPTNPLPLTIIASDLANAIIQLPPISIGSNQTRKVRIEADYLECLRDTIVVRPGHWCPGEEPCIIEKPLELYAEPKDGAAQIKLVQQPNAPVSMCTGIPYRLKILNVLVGRIFTTKVRLWLPPSGYTIVLGSCYLVYKGLTVPWPNPQIDPDGGLVWPVDFTQSPFLLDGLPGVSQALENSFEIGFQIETNCAYLDGSRFTYAVTWENVCGAPGDFGPLFSAPFQIMGAPSASNTYSFSLQKRPASQPALCGSQRIRITAVNKGGQGPTAPGEKMRLLTPGSLVIQSGTYQAMHNAATSPVLGFGFLDVDISPGVVAGDSVVFEVDIIPVSGLSGCSITDTIIVQMLKRQEVLCATAPGGTCAIDFIREDKPFGLIFEKPVLHLGAGSSVAKPGNTSVEQRFIAFNLSGNANAAPVAGTTEVAVYLDTNYSGALDSADIFIKNIPVALDNLFPGLPVTVLDTLEISPPLPCAGLLLVSKEGDCHCGTDTIVLPTARFFNAGHNQKSCYGQAVTLGLAPTPGALYGWRSANSGQQVANTSSFTYQSGDTFPPTGVVQESFILTTTFPDGGCTFIDTVTVTTNKIEVALNVIPPACYGQASGTITAILNIPDSLATFQWSLPVAGKGATLSGIAAGTYTVTVTNTVGCLAVASFSLSQPTPLTASITAHQYNGYGVSCAGAGDGILWAAAFGGTPPIGGVYGFGWSNSIGGSMINALYPGTYTVTVTDARGCTRTATANLTEPPALKVGVSATDARCNDGATGSLTLNISDGVAPYQVNGIAVAGNMWEKSGLLPGNYSYTVTDANGCEMIVEATVGMKASSFIQSVEPALCAGLKGKATITGNGFPPFHYTWSTGSTAEEIFVPAGAYWVTITDGLGCIYSLTATVTEPPVLTLDLSATQPRCFGEHSGGMTISPAGGTGPLTITLNGQPANTLTTGLEAGFYTVVVTDVNGCSLTASSTIDQPVPLIASATVKPAVCHNENSGIAIAAATGGTPPYNWMWSNGVTTEITTNLATGWYTLTVKDAQGCLGEQTVFVDQPAAYEPILTIKKPCFGHANGEIWVSGLPTGVYAGIDAAGHSADRHFTNITAGQHYLFLEDTAGCTSIHPVEIQALPQLLGTVVPKIDTINPGDSILLRIIPDNSLNTTGLQIKWVMVSPGWLSCDTCRENWAKPTVTSEIKVKIGLPEGCSQEEVVRIVVNRGIWWPNVLKPLSPANGAFTLFSPAGTVAEIQLLQMFNRWGGIVFEERHFLPNDLSIGWDGTFRSRVVDPAVYVWRAIVVYSDGLTEFFEGNVTVFR